MLSSITFYAPSEKLTCEVGKLWGRTQL